MAHFAKVEALIGLVKERKGALPGDPAVTLVTANLDAHLREADRRKPPFDKAPPAFLWQ